MKADKEKLIYENTSLKAELAEKPDEIEKLKAGKEKLINENTSLKAELAEKPASPDKAGVTPL